MTRDVKQLLNEMVGPPITLVERLAKGAIGSHRMIVDEYSEVFSQAFDQNPGIIYTNLELRPKGVLFHFNIKYTRYSWIIPFHKLVLFNSDAMTVHSDDDRIQIRNDHNLAMNHKILKKIMQRKAEYLTGFGGPNV